MTKTVPAPEIQITTYNKQYSLDLKDFANASLSFGDDPAATTYKNAKELFETTLLCKIFGIEYTATKDTSENITAIKMTYYKSLKYKMMYATGNDDGDTKKCLVGIVSDFQAIGREATDTEDAVDDPYTANSQEKVNIESLNIAGPYFFLLAHKDATTGTNAKPEENILRVHKIVKCPNTHFVAAKDATVTCGLFSGLNAPQGNDPEKDCIFGFFNVKINSDTVSVFYMPKNSCCLEGRSKEIISLPTPSSGSYPGYFKVSIPFIGVVA